MTLTAQRWLWTIGLCMFLLLMATCGLVVRAPRSRDVLPMASVVRSPGPTARRILLWGGLAFLPSCLMLAVTAHISTDVAPIPLVWVLPLAVYLASFVAAFARRSRQAPVALTRAAVVSTILSGILSVISPTLPIWLVVAVDLTTVALVSYAAHARLAATRPAAEHLTGFYLVVSAGGALGGLVNGIVAPMLFNRVWEYGLSLAAVPLLLIGLLPRRSNWITRRYHPGFRLAAGSVLAPTAMLAAAAALVAVTPLGQPAVLGVLALITAAAWFVARAPVALALCLLIGTGVLGVQRMATSMDLTRTFYGSYRLVDEGGRHTLVHGTTVHGTQFQDEARRALPTAYYAQAGPLGQAMSIVEHHRVGIVGLGAGGIAAYGRSGDHFTFFEIDPAIERIAENPDYFTYLDDSLAEVDVVVGDGRLKLAEQPASELDLIILDAFSSHSIPIHLLTREAMREYARRLAADGTLIVHISSRIFDLEPVLAATAATWVGQLSEGSALVLTPMTRSSASGSSSHRILSYQGRELKQD